MGGVIVEGRSLACLVAADCLARAGVPVRLEPGDGPLGRSFAPIVADGRRLELGPRLLELSYDDDEHGDGPWCEPMEYTGGDHRPWMRWIRDYVVGLVTPQPARLEIVRGDRCSVDFLLTGNLRSLPFLLSAKEKRAIEADALVAMRVWPDGMTPGDLRNEPSYRVVSLIFHGKTFHDLFIGPLLDAMLGPTGDVPASDHRKVWLPLFKPLEILQGVWGESQRPRRSMHFGMGAAVEELVRRVDVLRGANLPRGQERYWPTVTDRIVDAVGPPGKTMDLRFEWFAAPGHPDGVTWLYDATGGAFRRTVTDGVACLESGPGRSDAQGANAVMEAKVPLTDGPVDPRAGVIGSGSFNAQILQGMAAAAWRTR